MRFNLDDTTGIVAAIMEKLVDATDCCGRCSSTNGDGWATVFQATANEGEPPALVGMIICSSCVAAFHDFVRAGSQ